jgi:hypothetical protein
MRPALVAITAVYLARGLFVLGPDRFSGPGVSATFILWSSLIVLVYGIIHAVGTWRAWPHLSKRNVSHVLGS